MSQPQSSLPRLRYRFLLLMLSPLLFAHLLWRAARDGGWQYLKQRLGLAQPAGLLQPVLWVHAASVGEINTVAPLLHALKRSFPDHHLHVTTNTPTGRAAFERLQCTGAAHSYLPLDFGWSVRCFYRRINPVLGIIIETELWPNLLHRASFPVCLVSARLSDRTMRHVDGWMGVVLSECAKQFHTVIVRDEQDIESFVTLGVARTNVHVGGNLKYSLAAPPDGRSPARLIERDYALLASTHSDEEVRIAALWLQHAPDRLLVIVPRHVERRERLFRQLLQLGSKIALRSREEPVTSDTQIYLADTYGELPAWYRHAEAVFVGGSLIERGGHNLLEPARLGKSVVTGPYTANFESIVEDLRTADALVECSTEQLVVEALLHDWRQPSTFAARGERARQVALRETDTAERIIGYIEKTLRQ